MKLLDILFESVVDLSEMPARILPDEFWKRLKDRFDNDKIILPDGTIISRYDFSNSIFNGMSKPFKYYCNRIGKDGKPHGPQIASKAELLSNRGQGCMKCRNMNISTKNSHGQEKYIEKAEKKWGKDRYDYSNLKYRGSEEPVDIICHEKDDNGEEHGPFRIERAQWFIGKKNPMYCPKCTKLRLNHRLTKDEYIDRVENAHGKGTFDFSKMIFKATRLPVKNIICNKKDKFGKKHGEFNLPLAQNLTVPNGGSTCPKCGKEKQRLNKVLSQDEWLERVRERNVNDDGTPKYTYENVENGTTPYIDASHKVLVTCNKNGHGPFPVSAGHHLYYRSGCPYCFTSKGEDDMRRYLFELGYKTIKDKKFEDCTNSWKGNPVCHKYKFDAYSEELNTVFEFDGGFHFKKAFKQTDDFFKMRCLDDKFKNDYCLKKGIKLVRIGYPDMEDIRNQIDKSFKSNEMLWLSDNYPLDKGWRSLTT